MTFAHGLPVPPPRREELKSSRESRTPTFDELIIMIEFMEAYRDRLSRYEGFVDPLAMMERSSEDLRKQYESWRRSNHGV